MTVAPKVEVQEARIQQMFTARRVHLNSVPPPPIRPVSNPLRKMFDQFFIIGVPPDVTCEPEPRILAMYPSTQYKQTNADLGHLVSLCFPNKMKRVGSDTSVMVDAFMFMANDGDNGNSFGICVHMRASPESNPFFATRANREWPFCFVLLTKEPFLSSHFQFLSFLSLAICGNVFCALKRSERVPVQVKGFCHESLTLDRTSPGVAVWPKLRAPLLLVDALTYYEGIPVIAQDSPVIDRRLCGTMPLAIPLHLSRTQCLSYATLDVLFSALELNLIIRLYSCVLMERRILILSDSPYRSSLAVIGLVSLLNPFNSCAHVIPVISTDPTIATLLDSPMPYIAGASFTSPGAEVVVNLDTGLVEFRCDVVELPGEEELLRKLRMLIENMAGRVTVPAVERKSFFGKGDRNPQFDSFIESSSLFGIPAVLRSVRPQKYIFTEVLTDTIRELFAVHVSVALSEKMKGCFVTDATEKDQPVAVLNREVFLRQFRGAEVNFYYQFCMTQIFQDFCYRTANDLEIDRGSTLARIGRRATCNDVKSPTKALSPFVREREGDM